MNDATSAADEQRARIQGGGARRVLQVLEEPQRENDVEVRADVYVEEVALEEFDGIEPGEALAGERQHARRRVDADVGRGAGQEDGLGVLRPGPQPTSRTLGASWRATTLTARSRLRRGPTRRSRVPALCRV